VRYATGISQEKLLFNTLFSRTEVAGRNGASPSCNNGRDPHILLELFKYIAENPEGSERLLRKLRAERPKKQMLAERLVY
jgi:hypothetical protein